MSSEPSSPSHLEVLRRALEPFATAWDTTFGGPQADCCSDNDLFDCVDPSDFRRAREALAVGEGGNSSAQSQPTIAQALKPTTPTREGDPR